MNIVRIEGTIQCSSKTLSQLLYDDYECIKYCDSMMETFEIVERFDDNNLAAYYKAKSYFGFDARDLVFVQGRFEYEKGSYAIVGKGVENYEKDPKFTKKIKAERCGCDYYNYIMRPDAQNPNFSSVVIIMHLDLRGWVPNWFQNMFNSEFA